MAYDLLDHQDVLFGGMNGNGTLGDTWTYDGTNWTRQSPASSPTARYGPGMTYDSTRRLVVLFGGYGGGELSDTWTWDGSTWTCVAGCL